MGGEGKFSFFLLATQLAENSKQQQLAEVQMTREGGGGICVYDSMYMAKR